MDFQWIFNRFKGVSRADQLPNRGDGRSRPQEPLEPMTPWYRGFRGSIVRVDEQRFERPVCKLKRS